MSAPEDHLIPTPSQRGFDRLPPIPGNYGGHAVVYESSAAEQPKLWLQVSEPNDLNAASIGGAIIGTCTLVDVVPIVHLGEEAAVRRTEVGTMGGEPNLMLCAPDTTWHNLAANEEVDLAGGLPPDDPESGVDFDASDYYESDVTAELPYGLFEPGRYAFLLADVVPVDPPVPFKGGQGLTKTWEPATVSAR
jgi:hypothetical protein